MEYIIAYDIPDNGVRMMVADYLLSFGLDRIQKSVYQGNLSAFELKEIKLQMKPIKFDIDIIFIPQCAKCSKKQIRIIYPETPILLSEKVAEEVIVKSIDINFAEIINIDSFEYTKKFEITEIKLSNPTQKKKLKQKRGKVIERVIILENLEVIILE